MRSLLFCVLLLLLYCSFVVSDCSATTETTTTTATATCSAPPTPIHYGLLMTADVEGCVLKGEKNTIQFLRDHARDYRTLLIKTMSVDKDGDPRLLLFTSITERNSAIVDAEMMTEDDIRAILNGTAPPPPTPVATIPLSGKSVKQILSILDQYNVPRGFPVSSYPDTATQDDLFAKK